MKICAEINRQAHPT